MKTLYDVIWSVTSEKDLVGIVEYIAADSSSKAFEIFKEIKQNIEDILLKKLISSKL